MNKARLAVLGVAVSAGGVAWFLAAGSAPPPPPAQPIIQAAPQIETIQVLVAARDVPMGTLLADSDLSWAKWPKDALSPQMLRNENGGQALLDDIKGSVTRQGFLQGEPIRREKLVKGPSSGFMSAILPQGYRAVAINIDSTGATSAGGFILPNDRVDVVRVFRDDFESKGRGSDAYASETVLQNVRVLAIGQNVQEKNGERVVTGTNATLELNPQQAEQIVQSQRTGGGNLTLILRSMLDSGPTPEGSAEQHKSMNIVRFGYSSQR